jgi:PAS domain-containing protein
MHAPGEHPAGGRRGETELREVLDAVPANLWSTRPDGSVDFINHHWEEFTGLPRGDALG